MRNRVIDNSAQNNLVVHKSGNEIIADNKTFTGSTTLSGLTAGSTTISGLNVTGSTTLSGLTAGSTTISGLTTTGDIVRTINIDVTTSPTNAIYILPWKIGNSEQSILAYQQIAYFTNGSITNSYGLRRTVNGSNILNSIEIEIDSNGNRSVNVVTPETTSNGQNIATTAWVNNFCKTTNRTITAVYGDNTNWRRVWSDGWLEQGGIITGTISGNTYSVTKTFAQAFQNIPTLVINFLSTQGNGYQSMRSLTTTYFSADALSAGGNYQANANGFSYYACGY